MQKSKLVSVIGILFIVIGIAWATIDGLNNLKSIDSSTSSTKSKSKSNSSNNNSYTIIAEDVNDIIVEKSSGKFYYKQGQKTPYKFVNTNNSTLFFYYYYNEQGTVDSFEAIWLSNGKLSFEDKRDYFLYYDNDDNLVSVYESIGPMEIHTTLANTTITQSTRSTIYIEYDNEKRVVGYDTETSVISTYKGNDNYSNIAKNPTFKYAKDESGTDYILECDLFSNSNGEQYILIEANEDYAKYDLLDLCGIDGGIYDDVKNKTLSIWGANSINNYYYDDNNNKTSYLEINGKIYDNGYSNFNYDGRASDYDDKKQLFSASEDTYTNNDNIIQYVKDKNGEVYKTSELNVRDKASLLGNRINSLSQGKKVTIVDYYHGWYKVQFKGNEGWVRAEFIKILN